MRPQVVRSRTCQVRKCCSLHVKQLKGIVIGENWPMVYWFFRYGYAVAIYLVWPALLMAGGLVVVALSRGREGRRSLHTSSPRRNRLVRDLAAAAAGFADRKSTRLNSSHQLISYA